MCNKMTFSALKVIFSFLKTTFSRLKVTFSELKVMNTKLLLYLRNELSKLTLIFLITILEVNIYTPLFKEKNFVI